MPHSSEPRVAYFTMEIGLEPSMPTYSGGLGVLAGDTVRAAADLEFPLAVVTLLYHRGYFHQRLDEAGSQTEVPVRWKMDRYVKALEPRVSVEVEGRTVTIRAWLYQVVGVTDYAVPVYLLDTDLPENSPADRRITDQLYGGDKRMRLLQETVLGIGGVRMMRALDHRTVERFHMNEGHAALITLSLIEEKLADGRWTGERADAVRAAADSIRPTCVFTTHTPVPAGHDAFPADMAEPLLGRERWADLSALGQAETLNMTRLALRCSGYVNGVAWMHGQVTQKMFPDAAVSAITNGVHVGTWAAPAFHKLFDRHLSTWRRDSMALRYAIAIPREEVRAAHQESKRNLLTYVNKRTGGGFEMNNLTLGFARRATAYKRAALMFQDLDRLKAMARYVGPLQIVMAGKAHPHDNEGKDIIRRLFETARGLKGKVPVIFLEDYDMTLGKLLTSGVDVWVNLPRPPLEASGTSGMKAAVNGVPSLSVKDGWWLEGCIEGETGWAVGELLKEENGGAPDVRYAAAFYDKLSKAVMPCYYKDPDRFTDIMRKTIALNGSHFNTHRMFLQYVQDAYRIMHW